VASGNVVDGCCLFAGAAEEKGSRLHRGARAASRGSAAGPFLATVQKAALEYPLYSMLECTALHFSIFEKHFASF